MPMHNIFLCCGALDVSGAFLLLAVRGRLGGKYLACSRVWGSKNTLGIKYALHVRAVRAPPNTFQGCENGVFGKRGFVQEAVNQCL